MQTTTRLRIIAALLIVVIALAAGLLFFMPTKTTQASSVTPDPPVNQYQVERDAEIGLEPSVTYTQTIGGSKDEQAVGLFYAEEKLYIFGNTASSDCDFTSAGAFVAILSKEGRTNRFVTFDGELVDVTLYNGGFLMALRRTFPTLIAVDYAGDQLGVTELATEREEIPIDLLLTSSGYLLVTKLSQSITGFTRLKLNILSHSLQPVGSLITEEVYNLEYIDTLDVMGEYMLLANAKSDLRNMLCYGTWGKKLAHYPREFSYKVSSFWILDDFYYLASSENVTMLIKENSSVIPLSETPQSGRVVGDERCLYVSLGSDFLCLKDDKILFSDNYGETSFYVDEYIYAVSAKDNRLAVRSFYEGNKTFESSFSLAMTNPQLLVCEEGMFVIGSVKGKLGGDDIALVKVNY